MKKDPTGFKKGPKKFFPAWRFGPGYVGPDKDGREDPAHARLFHKQDDVPEGWFATAAEAKAYAAEQAAPPTAKEPVVATPAPNKGKGKSVAKPVDERGAKIAALVKAGYDPKELESASDADLDSALKDQANGAKD
jgi:hypothetical protein